MRWLLALALLAGLLSQSAAAAQDRLDTLFTGYMRREGIPGAVLVVLRGDEVTIARAWGVSDRASGAPMQVDGVQPFYSIGKQFTAATVLRLVEQGRVELDAPVGRYLPQWFADEPGLRVRHLLRHTSGLANFIMEPEAQTLEQAAPGTGSIADMAALVNRLPRRFMPGARHAYSNGNYTVLAALTEAVAGRPFAEAQRALVLRPLGLDGLDECADLAPERLSAGHEASGARYRLPSNPRPTYAGNGGLCGDALSLARWTRALGAGRVLRGDLAGEMRRGERTLSGHVPPYGFGLSTLAIAGRPAFSHAGGGDGWGAWAAYLPDEQLSIVILANRGWVWSTDLGVPVVRVLLGLPEPPPLRRLRLTTSERRSLTGAFEDGLFELELEAGPDRLLLTNPPFGAPIELWKQPDGRFVAPQRPDTFSLRLIDGRAEFDWMEHRSYLLRRPAAQLVDEPG